MSKVIHIPVKNSCGYYPTPFWCVTSMVRWLRDVNCVECFNNSSLIEPCVGGGNIILALQESGMFTENHIYALDINISRAPKFIPYMVLQKADFLSPMVKVNENVCITNPPFPLAESYLRKLLIKCDVTIMLLQLSFLASKDRSAFFNKDYKTPDTLLVLSDRPSFTGEGTNSQEYGWMIWNNNPRKFPIPKGIFCISKEEQ